MRDALRETRVGLLSERADLFGGGQRSLCDLAGALRDTTRVRPLVVVPSRGPLTEALDALRVEWITVPLPPLASRLGFGAVATIARLRRLIRARRLDILHSDSPRTALYAGLATRSTSSCRHVFHLRSSRASSGLADRFLVTLSDRVIAVSRAAASRSAAVRASRKTRVVLTGLPAIDFLAGPEARRRLGLPAHGFICGVVGRVEADKGRDEALAALAPLRRGAPGGLLVFLGPFDPGDPWAATCALRAATVGASGAVRLCGPRPEAARLLKAFDLLLHPSRHEALPRVVIEAQLAEVPVVAAAVGGVVEIIGTGRSGLLVPPGDTAALGEAAESLARDPVLRRRLAQAALEQARERFGVERMAKEIVAVYDELAQAPAGAPLTQSSGSAGGSARRATP